MVDEFMSPEGLGRIAEPLDAVVIGPAAGLTEATAFNLAALGRTGAALIVDADALTLFRGRASDLFASLDRDDVLTPHEGEFERVFPGLLAGGRELAAVEASRRAGAVVVLKGRQTVIAAPDGRVVVNANGVPWLATAGSGDVLAGMIGARLASGQSASVAARDAVWQHGALADHWPATSALTASALARGSGG